MTDRVLAVLGIGLLDPAQPVVRADDLGLLRGDGIFETLLVRRQRGWLLDEHLARLAISAERMDLTLPPPAKLRELIGMGLAAWPAGSEGVLRLVCTRGPEDGGPPTVYVAISPVPAETLRQRSGVHVITRSLGLPADLRAKAPWLLGGVKTTSYAVPMAVLRDARQQGADDVIWVSEDGEVLEGPTASVVWARGGTLHTIPPDTGILEGTTVAHLMARAPRHGFTAATTHATIDDLHAADGVWLLSSVRGAAPVLDIDGRCGDRADPGLTGRILTALGLDPTT